MEGLNISFENSLTLQGLKEQEKAIDLEYQSVLQKKCV